MVSSTIYQVLPKEQLESVQRDPDPLGNQGSVAAYPETEEQIAQILKYAHENNVKVIPVGGGTKRGFGGTEERADLLLSFRAYKGIIEYSQGDMTITVKAGTTIKEIAEFLKPNHQMLPLDPAWPEWATIGGVAAANDSGPKRCRYGSARDLVIGMRIVYPDGRIIRTGGKVVKNVAGYDMNKLFVGSMGTLGIISEITLKLRPMPKFESLSLLTFPQQADMSIIRSFCIGLLNSHLEPVSLELLSPVLNERLNGKNGYALAIAFEDMEKSVRYQEDWVKSHQPADTDRILLNGEEAAAWWNRFAQISPHGAAGTVHYGTEATLKLGSKNLDALELIHECHQLGERSGLWIEGHGGAGHGLSKVYMKGDQAQLSSFVQEIRSLAEAKGGYAILQHASLALRREAGVWGKKPVYFPLLEGIKKTIDPRQVLNAKRFIGGI